jgi:ABC-type transport system involved in multi-copper enzyme maturation permease subunit
MIGNPIIRREVSRSLRSGKAVLMQAAFFLVAAALVWMNWPPDGLQDLDGNQAKLIFNMLAVGELLMVVLFAPAFTAASLTTEKEHGTFESVFSTSLRPWEIALGKMVGSLSFLLLMVLTGAVALSAPLMMGGVTGAMVLQCMGVLLLTAVYLGMIGLLVSSMLHRSYRAIIVTYAVLGVVVFLFALPCWPVGGDLVHRGDAWFQNTLHVLASFSPLQAMLSILWPSSVYSTGAAGMPPFWQLYLPISCGMIVLTAIICFVKLHAPVAPPRPREGLLVIERDGKVTGRDVLFLIDPRKRKRAIVWWQNPVLIKECRTRPMLQASWLIRAFAITVILSVVLIFPVVGSVGLFSGESADMNTSILTAVASMMVMLVLLIGPAISGGTICGDIETGVWDLMRTTRLSSWRIVSGKFQAAIIPMLLLIVATTPALMILLFFDRNVWFNLLRVLEVVSMTALFVAVAGMFFSSIFLKTSTATAWTYAMVIAVGLLALLVMLGQDQFSQRFVSWVYVVNPIAAVLDAAGQPAMSKLGILARHMQIIGIATAAMVLVTVVRVFQLRRAT